MNVIFTAGLFGPRGDLPGFLHPVRAIAVLYSSHAGVRSNSLIIREASERARRDNKRPLIIRCDSNRSAH